MMVQVIRSPIFNERSPESWVAPSPNATIWPTISCPKIMGVGADLRPVHECTSDPQIVQQVQPMVLEQQALDWLMENGKTTAKKVAFSEYMNS